MTLKSTLIAFLVCLGFVYGVLAQDSTRVESDSSVSEGVESVSSADSLHDSISVAGSKDTTSDTIVATVPQADPTLVQDSYTLVLPGKLEARSDAPVFDIPSTAGTFNHGVSFGAKLLFYEEQDGFYHVMNEKKEPVGWVSTSAVEILVMPETLSFVADSARAVAIVDSVTQAFDKSLLPPPVAETDTVVQFGAVEEQDLKAKIMAFVKGNKRLVMIGGGVVAGTALLAVLVSSGGGSESSAPAAGGGGGGGGGGAEEEIPPINIPPPGQ